MNPIEALSSGDWNQFGTALLHSLWQGGLIAALLYVHLRVIPAQRPQLRYMGGIGALLALLVSSFLTWAYLDHERPIATTANPIVVEEPMPGTSLANPESQRSHTTPSITDHDTLTPQGVFLFLWIIGVDIMLIRLSLSLADLKDLRERATVPVDQDLPYLFKNLLHRTGTSTKRLSLLVAESLTGPVAFGFWHPTIVIPLSLATRTPPALLEAMLAHELAHIRRHDYIVNLGQLLIETLLFFNPAVWWISQQIRTEREACCDADAIKIIGSETNYATALADYAETNNVNVAALPFGKARRPGSLIERVRRILVPNYRPSLKLPLPALTLFLLFSGLALLALHQGSKLAIAVGAELLSPEARIAQIKTLQETHPTFDPNTVFDDQLAQEPGSRVTISGTIQSADGSPLLDDRLQITAASERPRYSSSHAVSLREGQFTARVQPGQIHLSAYSPNYAPSFLGPFQGPIAGTISNIVINLKPGFLGKIRVLDEDGQPVKGARLTGYYDFASQAPVNEVTSNANGLFEIPNTKTHPIKLNLRADGFEEDFRVITLNQAVVKNWQLERAEQSTIILRDRSGRPIPGATANLMRMQGLRNISYGNNNQDIYAVSDADGQLKFTELRTDSTYWFLITAVGYGKHILSNVTAGEANREIVLQEPLSVKGTITGDLTLLETRSRWIHGQRMRLPVVRYRNPFEIEGYTDSSTENAFVQIEGDRATFEIKDLWAGKITLIAGPLSTSHNLDRTETNIEISLTPESIEEIILATRLSPLPERSIRVNFKTPAGDPPASGSVRAFISAKQPEGGFHHEELSLPLENGSAKHSIPVGSRVRIQPDHFLGYWFPSSNDVAIPGGETPYEIELDCYPAGAIYGSVQEANGAPAKAVMISLIEVERAPNRPHSSLDVEIKNGSSSSDATKSYTATPLPIGGTYMIIAHRDTTYAVSPALQISAGTPIREANLVLQTGVAVHGCVLQPNGEPAAGIHYEHHFQARPNHGFSSSGKRTDRLGRFHFKNVVPELPGSYGISFRNNPGYQRLELSYQPGGGELVIQLETGNRISGTIVDAETGWPIPGVEVYALPRPYSPDRTGYVDADSKTDLAGRFEFTTLDDGEYQLGNRSGKFSSRTEIIASSRVPEIGTLPITLNQWSKLVPVEPKSH